MLHPHWVSLSGAGFDICREGRKTQSGLLARPLLRLNLLACLLACLLVLFYLTFANILGVIFTFYRYKFNDNIRDTAQLTEKILRVVLKILDLSFLPILVFSVSAAFRSDAFTQCSMLITQSSQPSGRRDARRANSRGFLNPWYNWQDKEMASAKTRTCGEGCRSASSRRHYYVVIKNRGLKSPRLFISTSFRRIFSHYSLLIAHYSLLKGVWKTRSPKGE